MDDADYEHLFTYRWHATTTGYARSQQGATRILMHRVILGVTPEDKRDVDHIDHNRLNNQRANLRVVTKSQNQMNRLPGKNNTSGVIGVHWDKEAQLWCVTLHKHRRQVYIKRFKSFEDAVAARKRVEQQVYEEYAPRDELPYVGEQRA